MGTVRVVGSLAVPSAASGHYDVVKRLFDLTVAALALLVLSPVLLVTALAVWLTSPGPILFAQTRVGQGEREFRILKFRTMYRDADDRIHRELNTRELQGDRAPPGTNGCLFRLESDPRVTWLGYWLRRTAVDELPQLLNVLRGDMSLIGPRPSLPWEVEMYTPEQRRRHDCKPGMTGLWQVSDRYSLSMPEMLALDLEYVRRKSLMLDLWIVARTPRAVLFGWSAR